MDSKPYIGRFAPTPSGPLHFGSLVAALASYLDARANQGRWLVRMEDIDPPREQLGAASQILQVLEAYGMEWDGKVMYQSNRYSDYQTALDTLLQKRVLYPCVCSRKKLTGLNGVYPGYCRGKINWPEQPYSLRLQCTEDSISFVDLIQGDQKFSLLALGDFILRRKDQLYAYQLAVSVDDAFQNITHIVRGYDLLDSTPRQLHLQSVLSYSHPVYAHVPVITKIEGGDKLSKQNWAKPLPLNEPRPLLVKAMKALGLPPNQALLASSIQDILKWGIEHWDIYCIPKASSIALPALA